MRWIFVLMLAASLLSTQQAGAVADSDFRLQIAPKECTIDTLNTGVSQSTTLQPETCQPLVKDPDSLPGPVQSVVEPSVPAGAVELAAAQQTTTQDATPGDQGMFENSIAEPLASWLGIGNKEAPPPVQLAVTSAAFVTVMGVVVDAGFFGLAYTQAIWGSLRRTTGRSIYALLRVFFPR